MLGVALGRSVRRGQSSVPVADKPFAEITVFARIGRLAKMPHNHGNSSKFIITLAWLS
jgi:hypothetical protein